MEIFQVLVVVAMIAIAVWQKSREKRVKRMQIRKQELKKKLDAHLTVVPPPIPVEARTKKKEEFVPINGNNVTMYACGVTVYDLSHIGHARQAIVYSMMADYLRYKGYNVKYVRNYTCLLYTSDAADD